MIISYLRFEMLTINILTILCDYNKLMNLHWIIGNGIFYFFNISETLMRKLKCKGPRKQNIILNFLQFELVFRKGLIEAKIPIWS